MATNSGSEKVGKLSDSVDELKAEVKAATKNADISGSKYSDLAKEMAILTAKVMALGKK